MLDSAFVDGTALKRVRSADDGLWAEDSGLRVAIAIMSCGIAVAALVSGLRL